MYYFKNAAIIQKKIPKNSLDTYKSGLPKFVLAWFQVQNNFDVDYVVAFKRRANASMKHGFDVRSHDNTLINYNCAIYCVAMYNNCSSC